MELKVGTLAQKCAKCGHLFLHQHQIAFHLRPKHFVFNYVIWDGKKWAKWDGKIEFNESSDNYIKLVSPKEYEEMLKENNE